jgi:osmotically-inducible protein OsmY
METYKVIVKALIFLAACNYLSSCAPVVLGAGAATGVVISQERSAGEAVDDAAILAKINSAFLQHDVNNLFINIDVKVNEGRVLLTGHVPTEETRIKAVQLSWEQSGVREVINELTLAEKTGKLAIGEYSKDVWITAQIKSRMLVDKNIKSVNYSIETLDGVVYIFGIAQSNEELNKVTNIASTVKYVNKVISHVRTKDHDLRKNKR